MKINLTEQKEKRYDRVLKTTAVWQTIQNGKSSPGIEIDSILCHEKSIKGTENLTTNIIAENLLEFVDEEGHLQLFLD